MTTLVHMQRRGSILYPIAMEYFHAWLEPHARLFGYPGTVSRQP